MKFSITDSLLQRNDLLIKEILRLRKKNNKLMRELKEEKRKGMHLNLVSTSTQTSADMDKVPKSPISREKNTRRIRSAVTSPINTHLVTASPHNSHSLLETYVSPSQTSFLLEKDVVITPPRSDEPNDSFQGVRLEFDDQLQLNLDDVMDAAVQATAGGANMQTPEGEEVRGTERRSRRSSMGTPLSYKEPSLNKKIRKGHQYFIKK
jgi:hypothetical protein